ncbi:hypothetical protein VNO77_23427 [Canavalia gladiata]|uniref:Protein kinase domain-containing protein n=1 Tax=Canavalia gladiata TaxID=3824 RepID=A0AAN9L6W4_CANGL
MVATSSSTSKAPQKTIIVETGECVDVNDVKINTILVVKVGDAIPLNGIMVEEKCEVDEKMLTGESFPVNKELDSIVWAGTVISVQHDTYLDLHFSSHVKWSVTRVILNESNVLHSIVKDLHFSVLFVILCYLIWLTSNNSGIFWVFLESLGPDSEYLKLTIHKFLNEMEKEKPIKFSDQHLKIATNNYSNLLGSGGFGAVYKGKFRDGTMVAVKVLRGSTSNDRIEEQFMAEVGTIGKFHHLNLVRLYGFCFEKNSKALVYEYMENGSLDNYLFHENNALGFERLYEIAVGTAKGIAYLHEECQQRIIHYDIKPGNILLDNNFNPKVADFGLAKLCNRENTHITMTGVRGTLGYAAPELWMPKFPVTHKCDVYSFGILLFEIIGRRRHFNVDLPESQEWFPTWVWKKFDAGELEELTIACRIEENNKDIAERMVNVALSCVQYRPESRPIMSDIVKMLEGSIDIPKPMNPFQHLIDGTFSVNPVQSSQNNVDTTSGSDFSVMVVTEPTHAHATPIMMKPEIESTST